MTTKRKQCSAEVYPVGALNSYLCSKPAVVERDRKWFCKIHDPEYIKAKRERESAVREVRNKENEQFNEHFYAVRAATAGLTIEELNTLTPNLGRAAPQMYEALKAIQRWEKIKDGEILNMIKRALAEVESK